MNSKELRVTSCLSFEESCWVLSCWESWDTQHALRTPCWLLAFSGMRLLWRNWTRIISHVESISVCALSVVIWPLQSILFIPSTFYWQRYRHICPHMCLWSPLCGERKLLTYRGKEVVMGNRRENQVKNKSSYSPLLGKLGQKREIMRNWMQYFIYEEESSLKNPVLSHSEGKHWLYITGKTWKCHTEGSHSF